MTETPDCFCPWQARWWKKIKWASLGSLTVGWSYALFVASALMELVFQLPDIATEFGLNSWVPPRWLPWYTAAMALITLMARLRGIMWQRDPAQEFMRRMDDPNRPDAKELG